MSVNPAMPFPRRFQHLIETELEHVEAPDYAWLVYVVCAVAPDACGWGGWMLEAAFKRTTPSNPDQILSVVDEQICPRCGRQTYRTGASLRMEPSQDQTPVLRPGTDYEGLPLEFED